MEEGKADGPGPGPGPGTALPEAGPDAEGAAVGSGGKGWKRAWMMGRMSCEGAGEEGGGGEIEVRHASQAVGRGRLAGVAGWRVPGGKRYWCVCPTAPATPSPPAGQLCRTACDILACTAAVMAARHAKGWQDAVRRHNRPSSSSRHPHHATCTMPSLQACPPPSSSPTTPLHSPCTALLRHYNSRTTCRTLNAWCTAASAASSRDSGSGSRLVR